MNVHANLYQYDRDNYYPLDYLSDGSNDLGAATSATSRSGVQRGLYVRILNGLCVSRGCLVGDRIEQEAMEVSVLINMAGIMGAGLSAFVGVKVALAQVQRDVKNLEKSQEKAERRIDRLEQRYFRQRDGEE